MHPEAMFLAGYAVVLVAIAAGLEALGHRSAHPWSSRILAASRPPDVGQPDGETDWPHSEVPVFHLAVCGVVLTAALALTAASFARHHGHVEIGVHLALLAFIATRIAGVVTRFRARETAHGETRPQKGLR
jgi:hypothetical protein